jgi:hypothetical protein
VWLRASVLALLAALPAALPARGAPGAPVTWSLNLAEIAVQDTYATGAQCVPVGPQSFKGKTASYREFACAVFEADGSQRIIAIAPASATKLDYATLDPGRPRPPGTAATTATALHYDEQIIIIDRAGVTIELEDESLWKLRDPAHLLSTWRLGDSVTIQPGAFYSVVDLTRHEGLEASFVGFDT